MRWSVEVSPLRSTPDAPSGPKVYVVDAKAWQPALQAAREQAGRDGPISGFSIELLPDGYRAIDPVAKTKYVIKRTSDDAPLSTTSPDVSPAAMSVAAPPAAPAATMPPDVSPAAMSVAAPPAAPETQRDLAPPTAATGAPSTIVTTQRSPEGATLPTVEVLAAREEDPSERAPITYRELTLAVPHGTPERVVEDVLRAQFFEVTTRIAGAPPGKMVNLAVFDVVFTGKPPAPPIATLAWKDWRGAEPEIRFPARERAAAVAVAAAVSAPEAVVVAHAVAGAAALPVDVTVVETSLASPALQVTTPTAPQRQGSVPSAAEPTSPRVVDAPPTVVEHPASMAVASTTSDPVTEGMSCVSPAAALTGAAPAPAAASHASPASTPVTEVTSHAGMAAASMAAAPMTEAASEASVAAASTVSAPAIVEAKPAAAVTSAAHAPAPAVMGPPSAGLAGSPSAGTTSETRPLVDASPAPSVVPGVPDDAPTEEVLIQFDDGVAEPAPPMAPAPAAPVEPPPPPAPPSAGSQELSDPFKSPISAMPPAVRVPPAPESRRLAGDELLTDLFEAMHEVHFSPGILEAARFVLQLALQKLPCDAGIVHYFDINKREFVVVDAVSSARAELLLRRTSEKEPLFAEALRRRRAVISGALEAPRWSPVRVESLVIAPVVLGGRFLGVIELANPSDGRPFSESDGFALAYMGEQLAEFLSQRGLMLDADAIRAFKP